MSQPSINISLGIRLSYLCVSACSKTFNRKHALHKLAFTTWCDFARCVSSNVPRICCGISYGQTLNKIRQSKVKVPRSVSGCLTMWHTENRAGKKLTVCSLASIHRCLRNFSHLVTVCDLKMELVQRVNGNVNTSEMFPLEELWDNSGVQVIKLISWLCVNKEHL